MERAIRTLCFFLPRASTITSPVGGSEGGAGREEEEGAGEEGTGEEGRDGGGAGQGEGETRGGESGEDISEGLNEEESEGSDGLSSGGGVGGEALQRTKDTSSLFHVLITEDIPKSYTRMWHFALYCCCSEKGSTVLQTFFLKSHDFVCLVPVLSSKVECRITNELILRRIIRNG